ncbi:unnamed protein product [Cyprideis torosa]|uniref:Uncharacterized protein n=1 Tax=Cyprideis torosa TaxID=163714 RepID=A0A7R8WLY7_9CRUS|nr:unnamed protein product [Cyprideis torosa]CAG0897824.1 unnamed protein product [Cyprideis torosa]
MATGGSPPPDFSREEQRSVIRFLFHKGLTGAAIHRELEDVLRDNAINCLRAVYNLAVSDLVFLVVGLPEELFLLWRRYPYIFGETFCVLRGLIAETSTNASVLTIAAFTVERYIAICYPLRSHVMSKLSRAKRIILIIWFIALIFAIPQISLLSSTLVFFIIPLFLITVLYLRLGIKLKQASFERCASVAHESKKSNSTDAQESASHEMQVMNPKLKYRNHPMDINARLSASRTAVIKVLVAVVLAFFLCWAPFHAQRLMAVYATWTNINSQHFQQAFHYLYSISGILYYTSATINPILYHTLCCRFRYAFKDTFRQCFKRGVRRGRRHWFGRRTMTSGGRNGPDSYLIEWESSSSRGRGGRNRIVQKKIPRTVVFTAREFRSNDVTPPSQVQPVAPGATCPVRLELPAASQKLIFVRSAPASCNSHSVSSASVGKFASYHSAPLHADT